MRKRGAAYECAQCGAKLTIDDDAVPNVTIHGASGKRNERVIEVHGKEVHRCTVGASSNDR